MRPDLPTFRTAQQPLAMKCGGCEHTVSEIYGFIIADWTDVRCWACWKADPRRPASREGARTEMAP